jgi:hypothetical protein
MSWQKVWLAFAQLSIPAKITCLICAADLLLGKDEYAARYVGYFCPQRALLTEKQSA